MHKVVYNGCYGGFTLSTEAVARLEELGYTEIDDTHRYNSDYYPNIERHNPLLVQVVEELGLHASGSHSQLQIEYISGTVYKIKEFDGKEIVVEPTYGEDEWVHIK